MVGGRGVSSRMNRSCTVGSAGRGFKSEVVERDDGIPRSAERVFLIAFSVRTVSGSPYCEAKAAAEIPAITSPHEMNRNDSRTTDRFIRDPPTDAVSYRG